MAGDGSPPAGQPEPAPAGQPAMRPTAGQTLAAMWLYTVLRFGMFLVLWALLWLFRVPGLLAALIALALSVPLSFVLLRRQRERVAANLEQRITARQAQRHDLDAKLSGQDPEL
ncbi:MAG TPA: DUF4229 domain-containing protein [Jatrophihabitans sp.]|nr:DUF4229 domain-containing protein [Jatrophihabitans sp.]